MFLGIFVTVVVASIAISVGIYIAVTRGKVDCELESINKQHCDYGCGTIPQTIKTPAAKGGKQCDMTPYQCKKNDGDCKGKWSNILDGVSCTTGHGSTNLNNGNPIENISLPECRSKCTAYSDADGPCDGILYVPTEGNGQPSKVQPPKCYLKKAIELDKCVQRWQGAGLQLLQ